MLIKSEESIYHFYMILLHKYGIYKDKKKTPNQGKKVLL